jgi:hypothetical protein
MIPEEYFQEHPDRYWLALAGPALTTGYALAKVRSASDAQQAWGYGALAAVCAAQVIGLLRLGPPGARPLPGGRCRLGDVPGASARQQARRSAWLGAGE